MKKENQMSDHLIRNLERIYPEKSIFNYKVGRRAFSPLGQGNISKWLETFSPKTRIILEPKIIGSSIGIQYIDGRIMKAINERSEDVTKIIMTQINIPKKLAIKKRIEILGVLYDKENKSNKHTKKESKAVQKNKSNLKNLKFCAFQIFHCNINHFQSLQELKKLNFEIPQTEFINFITEIDIYLQCWRDGKLFKSYPANGVVLKINSRKLQKYLDEKNISINWAYEIN